MIALRIIAVLLCGLVPVLAFAHTDQKSFELEIGNYFVDVGYDEDFGVGKDTLLDFQIFQVSTDTPFEYSSMSVSVGSGSTVQWSRTIKKPDLGKAITSIVPAESGHWELRVIFTSDSTVIADASFPITIAESNHSPYSAPLVLIAIAVIGSYAFFRSKPI